MQGEVLVKGNPGSGESRRHRYGTIWSANQVPKEHAREAPNPFLVKARIRAPLQFRSASTRTMGGSS